MEEEEKYWAALAGRIHELAPELTIELKTRDDDQGNFVLLLRHARTGKSRPVEFPEDPVWDMVDNLDKREEAKVDKAILEARAELEEP